MLLCPIVLCAVLRCAVQVFVITPHWGDAYFHFLSESLPRVTLMLDVLVEHPEIEVCTNLWTMTL